MARPDIETQCDGQNRGRKCQFEQQDFHAGQFRESRSKSNVPYALAKKRQSGEKKSKQEKTWKRRDFCARLLPPLGFPPWQCSCFVLEYIVCLAIGPKAA
jgi:hypothetical protein